MESLHQTGRLSPYLTYTAAELGTERLEEYIAMEDRRQNYPAQADALLRGWNNAERALGMAKYEPEMATLFIQASLHDLDEAHITLNKEAPESPVLQPAFIDTCLTLAHMPQIMAAVEGASITPNQAFKIHSEVIEVARYTLETWRAMPLNFQKQRAAVLDRASIALGIALLGRRPEVMGHPQLASPRERKGFCNVYTLNEPRVRLKFSSFRRHSDERSGLDVVFLPMGNILSAASFKDSEHQECAVNHHERMNEAFWLALYALEGEVVGQKADSEALDRATQTIKLVCDTRQSAAD